MPTSVSGAHEASVCINSLASFSLVSCVKPYYQLSNSKLLHPLVLHDVVGQSPWCPDGRVSFIPPQNSVKNITLNYSVSNCSIGWSWRHCFNQFVKLHCERLPLSLGFVSASIVGANNVSHGDGDSSSRGVGVGDNGSETKCVENVKKVLILMSDTGGGHRASAEAIKAAYKQEFGDEYKAEYMRRNAVKGMFKMQVIILWKQNAGTKLQMHMPELIVFQNA